jgi:transcriptional regulator with XRE-family HTH domain
MDALRFKGYCAANGIKQADVARLIGVGKSSISQKMNGRKNFTLAQVKKICEHFGISADEYFV